MGDTEIYDIAIIGCGVSGACLARELSRYQLKTIVFEKEADASFGTSKANSGIIHGGFHSKPGTLMAELCVQGNAMFDKLAEDLHFPFKRIGALVVAFTHEENQYLWSLYEQGQKNGLTDLCILSGESLFQMEPHINRDVHSALYSPSVGIIEPYEFCFASIENAVANGVQFLKNAEVININCPEPHLFEIRLKNGLDFKSRRIINAAGLFADKINSFLGLTGFTIHPRKGEEYLLDKRVKNLVNHVIFPVPTRVSKGMLVIPTTDGPVMVGPTAVDCDSRDDKSTTEEGLKQVFEHAQKLIPAIRQEDIITSFAGLRPSSDKHDFTIGPTSVKGYFTAIGIESPGLTASPAIALRLLEDLKQDGCVLAPDPDFDPVRARPPQVRDLLETNQLALWQELIKQDEGFGEQICRCENVMKAEIQEAIKRGHMTLDGLKFSTRAGSGRCQGGFCTHKLVSILHESGIEYGEISKKGPGSEILKGLKTGEQNS